MSKQPPRIQPPPTPPGSTRRLARLGSSSLASIIKQHQAQAAEVTRQQRIQNELRVAAEQKAKLVSPRRKATSSTSSRKPKKDPGPEPCKHETNSDMEDDSACKVTIPPVSVPFQPDPTTSAESHSVDSRDHMTIGEMLGRLVLPKLDGQECKSMSTDSDEAYRTATVSDIQVKSEDSSTSTLEPAPQAASCPSSSSQPSSSADHALPELFLIQLPFALPTADPRPLGHAFPNAKECLAKDKTKQPAAVLGSARSVYVSAAQTAQQLSEIDRLSLLQSSRRVQSAFNPSDPASIHRVPDGLMGTLRLRTKSGRATLKLGDLELEVSPGVPRLFQQQVWSLGGKEKWAAELGCLHPVPLVVSAHPAEPPDSPPPP